MERKDVLFFLRPPKKPSPFLTTPPPPPPKKKKKKKTQEKEFFIYIKQIHSMLQCICSVIDHRGSQNVVRTYTLCHRLMCHFFVLTTF